MNFANQQGNAAPVRRFTSRIISFLLVFGMLCGLFAFIPGVTAETAAYCGKAHHEHTPECYQTVQTEAGEETLCVCGAEEHIHTLSCYADPTADLQTPPDLGADPAGSSVRQLGRGSGGGGSFPAGLHRKHRKLPGG